MTPYSQESEARRRLRRAWTPFFARFGRLTPIQVDAIPSILQGKSVVITAPTASGKTEAVAAPLAERCAGEGWRNLSVLYLVPTRALANDALTRIQGPLQDMGLSVVLKHGDRPYLSRSLPDFLITTPESLDSLICRKPDAFHHLQALIIDEIHLLDNTCRGDQIRLLIQRLRSLASHADFSVQLMSATLSSPKEVASRYANDFEVVTSRGKREIDHHILDSLVAVHGLAHERGWKKLLVFCNMRESVERIGDELMGLWRPYPVVVHHGSLDRRIREEAEAVMKSAEVAVCVATSTLEVGIDVGDIDLVVIAETPWSLSSLLQRIGRGNRRKEIIHAAAIAHSADEKEHLESMFDMASCGELPLESYQADLPVAVQQIFSCLFQFPQGVHESTLIGLLSILCPEESVKSILDHLRHKDYIVQGRGCWYATSRLMNLGTRGKIHSNIPDTQSYDVVDVSSGRMIGTIAGVFDEVFSLGGRVWRVVSVSGNIIRAKRHRGRAPAPRFRRHRNRSAFAYLLPEELL